MSNDLIRAGVAFPKINQLPNHVLLQLWKQLQNDRKFQNTSRRVGVHSTNTNKNLEFRGLTVSNRRKKPPQVPQAMMPEPSEVKDLDIGQFMAGDHSSPRASSWDQRPYVELTIFWFLKEHTKGYAISRHGCKNINYL